MKIFNIGVAVMIASFGNLAMAEVYRTTTADGQVVYTDNVNSAYQYNNDTSQLAILDAYQHIKQAENQAQTTMSATQPNTVMPNSETNSVVVNTQQMSVTPEGFYWLDIVMPDEKMVYRRPNDIVVKVESKPALQRGDRFVYRINGKHIATTQESEYNISSMDYTPEKYTLTVQIENAKGKVVNEISQDFHLLANNFAIKQKRKAEAEKKAQQEAYDKLPWYKKIAYNINIGVK